MRASELAKSSFHIVAIQDGFRARDCLSSSEAFKLAHMPNENETPFIEAFTAILRQCVDQPESFHVNVSRTDTTVSLAVKVSSEDMGKLIGANGRTARALRTILTAVGTARGIRYSLDIERG